VTHRSRLGVVEFQGVVSGSGESIGMSAMSMGEDPRDESKGEEMEVKMEEAREDRSEGEERLRPGSPSSTLNTSSSFEHALAPLAGPSGGVRVNVQSIVFHRELGGGI